MTVYVEYVIIDNLIIDCLIASVALRASGLTSPKIRIAVSGILGSCFALIMPLIALNSAIIVLLKVFISIILVLCIFPFKGKKAKHFFLLYGFYLLFTFVFGGCALAFVYMQSGTVQNALYLTYFASVPAGVYVLLACAIFFPVRRLAHRYKKERSSEPYRKRAVIHLETGTVECSAFLDSGNRLFDPETGFPVVVVDVLKLIPLLGDMFFLNLLSGRVDPMLKAQKGHYITFNTLAEKRIPLFVFKPLKIEIYSDNFPHIIYDVMIGVKAGAIDKNDRNTEMILHPDLVC